MHKKAPCFAADYIGDLDVDFSWMVAVHFNSSENLHDDFSLILKGESHSSG